MEKPFCPICEKEYEPGDKFCRRDGAELIYLSGDALAGMVFDERYRLLHKIGEGGMGAVYKAMQISTGKHVAVKMLATHLTEDQATVKRFLREVRLQSKLSHPNIVTVIDFSLTPDKQHYFVMEFVDGTSLRNMILNKGGLELDVFYRIASQILFSLEYAHNQGVIHRDLKGENIMVASIGKEYVVKILDFGLAKAIYDTDQQSSVELTRMGKAFGTPAYMSPEQAMGEVDKISSKSDLYALGVIFFQMLTGRLPFESSTPWGYLHKHLNEPPPPITSVNPDLPKELERIILHCLEKDPDKRYQTALAIKEDLENVANKQGEKTRGKENSSWLPKAMIENVSLKQKRRILTPLIILFLTLAGWFGYQLMKTDDEKPELAQLVQTQAEKEKANKKEPTSIKAREPENISATKRVIGQNQTDEELIEDMLARASADLLAKRLTTPEGSNAYDRYQAVLRLDPGNGSAKEGIQAIAISYVQMADDALARKEFSKTNTYLNKASSISPGLMVIDDERVKLKTAMLDEERRLEATKMRTEKEKRVSPSEAREERRNRAKLAKETQRERKIRARDEIRHKRLKIKVEKYLKKAERYAKSNRFRKAEKVIVKARRILPDYKGTDVMAKKIARMKRDAPPKKSWFNSF